jgi:hypothetical protein
MISMSKQFPIRHYFCILSYQLVGSHLLTLEKHDTLTAEISANWLTILLQGPVSYFQM